MREILLCTTCCLVIAVAADARAAGPVRPEPVIAPTEADGVQRIRIVGGSYFFKPGHIVVKARLPVELTLVKEEGVTPHNFVLHAPEAGLRVDRELRTEPEKVLFTPTTPGKYAFYCSNKLMFLPSHRERGMEGVLEVVE